MFVFLPHPEVLFLALAFHECSPANASSFSGAPGLRFPLGLGSEDVCHQREFCGRGSTSSARQVRLVQQPHLTDGGTEAHTAGEPTREANQVLVFRVPWRLSRRSRLPQRPARSPAWAPRPCPPMTQVCRAISQVEAPSGGQRAKEAKARSPAPGPGTTKGPSAQTLPTPPVASVPRGDLFPEVSSDGGGLSFQHSRIPRQVGGWWLP